MPTTQEIADVVVEACRRGAFIEPGDRFWSDDVVSREAFEGPMAMVVGKAAVRAKGEWFAANHEVHEVKVEGPYVNGDRFVVRFQMDVTLKGGTRIAMDSMGLYTVKDDKIVEEVFLYGPRG